MLLHQALTGELENITIHSSPSPFSKQILNML